MYIVKSKGQSSTDDQHRPSRYVLLLGTFLRSMCCVGCWLVCVGGVMILPSSVSCGLRFCAKNDECSIELQNVDERRRPVEDQCSFELQNAEDPWAVRPVGSYRERAGESRGRRHKSYA